jgi:UDP-N-acetylglucosamine--N-acetylmuramyl-(pentapeptide) pyrophosphoryl-undecaprenol N-acetylglucosamine transferase
MFACLQRKGIAFTVLHICGFGDRSSIAREYAGAGVQAEVESFVEDIPPVYRGATLAIASAGAGTLAELSAAGVPSLLLPLRGAANDHQSANAREYAARTGARVIAPGEWSAEGIAERLEAIVSSPAELSRLKQGAREWKNGSAAARIVEACEEVLEPSANGARLRRGLAVKVRATTAK